MKEREKIRNLLKNLILDLSQKKYEDIVTSRRNGDLDCSTIEKLINNYPGNITLPPEEAFNEIDFIEYENRPGEGEIDFDLWYDNKRSDLTINAEVYVDNKGRKNIRIYDILVR